MAADTSTRIGYGLIYPFRREAADFATAGGQKLLSSCVRKVCNTAAAGFNGILGGEYPWRLNFGSWVQMMRHSNMNTYKGDLTTVYLIEAIERWEPRVTVQTDRSGEALDPSNPRAIRVRIYFNVADQLGGDIRTGSYEESYHEVTA